MFLNHFCPRFLTCSPCGGLPLATLITSCESEQLLTTAFQTLQESLPITAWYKRGDLGPSIFLTDDCSAEINALK